MRLVEGALGGTFVGGSGRNLIASGLSPSASGPTPPVGLFRPGRPDVYNLGIFTLTVTGASAATIQDATGVIATLTAGGTAPEGNYSASAYGKTTYNSGADFTIAAARESAASGAIPDALLSVTAGTAQQGVYEALTSASYVSATDAAWTILIAADGSAELRSAGAAMAVRAAGATYDPAGCYIASAAGETAHNSGATWRALIAIAPRLPRAGFVYLQITQAAGILTAAAGPFFASALPANTADVFHVAIAQSDGLAIEQYHTGLLIWPEPAAAGGGTSSGLEWIYLTAAAFDLLSPAEQSNPLKIYDIGP